MVQILRAHDEQQRNVTYCEVRQQCQLFSCFVFVSRCLFFNLGSDWCITHTVTDSPRDAIDLHLSRDMSGLTQYRHINDRAVSSAFSYFPVFSDWSY